MKKKNYEKPSMKVFVLKQKPMLLAGSGVGGMNPNSPYTPDGDPFNPVP